MLSSASRLLQLGQAVFLRPSQILSHPTNLVLVLDALQRLGLQPPLANRSHWSCLFEAALSASSSDTMDLRTTCKVFLTLTEMLRVESTAEDNMDFCRTPLLALQEKIFLARNNLEQFQLFDVLAAVIILSKRSQVVHGPLQSLVRSKAPLFSAELFRSKHIATLVAAVSTDPREYRDEDVVRQLRNLVEKRLPQLSHQDALVIFDALTSRHQVHGRTVQQAVPAPLASIRAALYEHATSHRHEMSSSHLSAWLSRIANDAVSDVLLAQEQNEAGGEDSSANETDATSAVLPQQFLAHVFRKLRQASYIDSLSEVAWHSTCMSVSRLWALPRTEIDFALLGNRSQRDSNEEKLKERESRLGLQRLQCAEWLHALMSNRLAERLSSFLALECALAVPTALLSVTGTVGSNLRAVVETYVDAHACSIAALSLSFTLKVLRCSINCALANLRGGGGSPTKTSVSIVRKVLSSTPRTEDATSSEEVDQVVFVNCLSTTLFAIAGSPFLNRQMHDIVVLVKPTLCNIAANIAVACQRNDPAIESLKTGALVKFLSSLSKLGVRKQQQYVSVVRVLVARQLTDFELIRVVIVASKQELIFPAVTHQVLAQLHAILTSVQFHQKVLLLESLGRLGVRWNRIQIALRSSAVAAVDSGRIPRHDIKSVAANGTETLYSNSTSTDEHSGQPLLRRPLEDVDKERWFFPKPPIVQPVGRSGVALVSKPTQEASPTESLRNLNALPLTLDSWFPEGDLLSLATHRALQDELSVVHLINAIHLVEYPVIDAANDATLCRIAAVAEQAALAASTASSSSRSVIQSVALLAQHVAAVAYLHSESRGCLFSLRYLKLLCEQLWNAVSSSHHPFQDFRALAIRWPYLTKISTLPSSSDFESTALSDVVTLLQKELLSVLVANLSSIAQSRSNSTFIIAQLRVSLGICGPEVLHVLGTEFSRVLVDRLVSLDLRRHMRALRSRDVVDFSYLLSLECLEPWLRCHEKPVQDILRLISDVAVPRFWNELADSDRLLLHKWLGANGLDVAPPPQEAGVA